MDLMDREQTPYLVNRIVMHVGPQAQPAHRPILARIAGSASRNAPAIDAPASEFRSHRLAILNGMAASLSGISGSGGSVTVSDANYPAPELPPTSRAAADGGSACG
jgi:hypothetical protein